MLFELITTRNGLQSNNVLDSIEDSSYFYVITDAGLDVVLKSSRTIIAYIANTSFKCLAQTDGFLYIGTSSGVKTIAKVNLSGNSSSNLSVFLSTSTTPYLNSNNITHISIDGQNFLITTDIDLNFYNGVTIYTKSYSYAINKAFIQGSKIYHSTPTSREIFYKSSLPTGHNWSDTGKYILGNDGGVSYTTSLTHNEFPAIPDSFNFGWSYVFSMTIDHTKIDSTLTDFPIYVNIGSASGITDTDLTSIFDVLTTDNDKFKLAVVTSNFTRCYAEIVEWSTTTRKAVVFVKVPSVSSVSDTVLYFYIDTDAKPLVDTYTYSNLSDEFSSSTQQTFTAEGAGLYGWNIMNKANCASMIVNSSNAGALTFIANSSNTNWDTTTYSGPFVYKNITGDFDCEILVKQHNPHVNFEFTWLTVKNPDVLYNWLHIGCGYNSTVGNPFLTNSRNNVNAVMTSSYVSGSYPYLRIVRIGSTFTTYRKANSTDDWITQATYSRADFPQTLQVGIAFTTYGDTSATYVSQVEYFRINTTPSPTIKERTLSYLSGVYSDTALSDEFSESTQQIMASPDGPKSYEWNIKNTASATSLDVNTTNAGRMAFRANAVNAYSWNAINTATLAYKQITGDFDCEIYISYSNHNENYEVTSLHACSINSNNNWISMDSGYISAYGANCWGPVTTVNSVSTQTGGSGWFPYVRLVRRGAVFSYFNKANVSDEWIPRISYTRSDFPDTLQVGIKFSANNTTATYVSQVDYIRFNKIIPSTTWDSSYSTVMHLGERGGLFLDSTTQKKDGTSSGGLTNQVDGFIGKAQNLDYISGDFISVADTGVWGASSYTYSFIMKCDSFSNDSGGGYNSMLVSNAGGNGTLYQRHFCLKTDGSVMLTHYTQDNDTLYNISAGAVYYMTVTYDSASKLEKLYVNGVEQFSINVGTLAVQPGTIYLGHHRGAAGYYFDGIIDEFRESNIARSPSWIKADYNSCIDNLITFGPLTRVILGSVNSFDVAIGGSTVTPTSNKLCLGTDNGVYIVDTDEVVSPSNKTSVHFNSSDILVNIAKSVIIDTGLLYVYLDDSSTTGICVINLETNSVSDTSLIYTC